MANKTRTKYWKLTNYVKRSLVSWASWKLS